ncbi:LOW QUALITY PROTEIN: E3 ubiquitin-protein ligase RNF114-like [Orycteropus afer afer]|uniref:RING-type E3 ubiquitin transferase n=1 Tax=Orycteropus afer afer TaxID=1230840 RepID=A0A8B7AV45_ORYAF|nr:LOW QUALITY PROTEIN: E3 ubiquitin-protein ligase RNF114-like [Orycteropus afer afer]
MTSQILYGSNKERFSYSYYSDLKPLLHYSNQYKKKFKAHSHGGGQPLGCFICCVPCGHVFCSACLQECLKPKKPVCGVCHSTLAPGAQAMELESRLKNTETSCHGCCKNFFLSKIQAHVATCSTYQNYIIERVKVTVVDAFLQPRTIPNIYNFLCPYFPEKNFDQEELLEHCRLFYSTDTKSVVSPTCTSVPWEDPNYCSTNFIEHIQSWHQFSYDSFVDYHADEEDMKNQVLQPSIMDQ